MKKSVKKPRKPRKPLGMVLFYLFLVGFCLFQLERCSKKEGKSVLSQTQPIKSQKDYSFLKSGTTLTYVITDTKQMIAAGKYDWVNPDITQEHFPFQGQNRQQKEVTLFHFKRTMSSEDAISEIVKRGFQPANIEDLLALGSQYPDLQTQFVIGALGSVWQAPDGHRKVPCIGWGGWGRYLHLRWFESDWGEDCRFLAVRKIPE